MTVEDKRLELSRFCDKYDACGEGCPLSGPICKCGRGFTFTTNVGKNGYMTDDEINAAYTIAFPAGSAPKTTILDSGNRTEFESGAVRDIQEGKGRCDLLPLDVVAGMIYETPLEAISQFQQTGNHASLEIALCDFTSTHFKHLSTTFLEVAKHFEDGAKKYGERNWEKGIPVSRYIDSGVRHYLKHLRGDTDERHDRAFCWNMMCAIWTCKHKPELNDYAKNE